jgi:hypothetical protein
MVADEFSDWQQKTGKTISADAHYQQRAYRLAMTALVVAICALAVSMIVALASLSPALSPGLEPPTAVHPVPAKSQPHPPDAAKTARRAD